MTANVPFSELLEHSIVFGDLDETEVSDLERYALLQSFEPRSPIFYRGDPGSVMYVVVSGQVKVSVLSPAGKECVLNFLGPGDVLGEIALLDGGERTADATAVDAVTAFALQRRDVKAFLDRHPEAWQRVVEALCSRLRHTSSMVEDDILFEASARLARAILRLLELHGRQEADGIRIDLKLSQTELGSYARLARANVNRQMRIWAQEGLIDVNNGIVTVKDADALREIGELFTDFD